MSSLNILCSICSDFFKNNDVIYSTRCGHVFHKSCLFKWINKSHTCPQCRRHCMDHLCHRLFLNFVEAPAEDIEMDIDFPKTYEWIPADADYTNDMSFAFMLGWDADEWDIYLARSRFNGNLIPGFYIAAKSEVVVSWESETHYLTEDIELLDISNDAAHYKWTAASNGNVPENAFATGSTISGEILYSARAVHKGKLLYGKLQRGSFQAYLPYEDEEVTSCHYEVLVRIPSSVPVPINEEKEHVELQLKK